MVWVVTQITWVYSTVLGKSYDSPSWQSYSSILCGTNILSLSKNLKEACLTKSRMHNGSFILNQGLDKSNFFRMHKASLS